MLLAGGITCYKNKKRIGYLLRNQKRIALVDYTDKLNGTNLYCFVATKEEREFDNPKQQRDAFKEKERPQVEPKYFTKLGINFKFIKTSTSQTTANTAVTSTSATPQTAASHANNNSSSTARANIIINNNNNKTAPTNNNNNNSKSGQHNNTSNPSIASESGFMFARLDLFEDIISATDDHHRKCHGKLCVVEKKRFGFEVLIEMDCKFCKKSYKIRSGPKPVEEPIAPTPQQQQKKRGRKPSPLNMHITNAMHSSAITVAQMQGLCGEIGCVSPSETGQHAMWRKRKDAIKQGSKEVLRNNRIEHVTLCREMNPERTVKHIDADGKEHNLFFGGVCADGAGDKRAYNHIITGSQHCTVVFSLVTEKVIAVKHDQVSCDKCTLLLTQLLAEGKKRSEDITEDDLKHDGKCYINSKHGPAVAEEFALEKIAEDLLIDPVTGKLRPDDEAILVDWFVADGDTKGASRV